MSERKMVKPGPRSRPVIERFLEKTEKTPNCWIWKGFAPIKSGNVRRAVFHVEGKQKYAARVAWQLFCGEIPVGMLVCHKCDNPLCVNPNHLFIGTARDNSLDWSIKGRPRHQRKLTKEDVLAIRASTEGIRALGRKYGVNKDTIKSAKIGQSWSWLSADAGKGGGG